MSSTWAPPSAQQFPATPTGSVDALLDRIRRLEGIVAEVVKGSPLRQAGLGVAPGRLEVSGDLLVSGAAAFTGDTTIGGSLDVSGSAEVTGTLTIVEGNLVLGDGMIEGAALANQLVARGAAHSTSAFASNASGWNTLATATITDVPSWATAAVVMATGTLQLVDAITGLAVVDARVGIAGGYGAPIMAPASPGANATVSTATISHTRVFAPGASIACVIQAQPSNPANFPAHVGNAASVNVVALLLR